MSISVKNISVSIDNTSSSAFDIDYQGTKYRMDNFSLHQSLLSHCSLSFTMHKALPEEDINEPRFELCGQLIGKKIDVLLETVCVENESFNSGGDIVADIEFKGFIAATSASRDESRYSINIEALSWDALLDDAPTCKSFEQKSLTDIVKDITTGYSDLETSIAARYSDNIPYCVQYNESNYQFIRRLARRYGEWLYSDGKQMVFGKLNKQDSVTLAYPSIDIPSYSVDLRTQHLKFNHLASSYNEYAAKKKEGIEESNKFYNQLNDSVYNASNDLFSQETLQNLHSGGYADSDGRQTVLNISTKTQARGAKAGLLTYSGHTYCSKLRIGATLIVKDNFITDSILNTKSPVDQDRILITQVSHQFSADKVYENYFVGIPDECDYPPYPNSDVYPVAPSCRAKVMDNEDPNNLGRVRVQFDWQAELDANMWTPWLRIAQPYAGGEKGFSFIPEKGEEVMIDFEGGNAERPYVKGTLFNGVGNPDGKWLPGNNSSNQVKAIRTRNGHTIEIHDEGNDGYIRIYDNKKENYILTFSTDEKLIKLESTGNIELYAANDIIMHAGHDIEIKAGNDRRLEVGQNDTTTVGHDQKTGVRHNQRTDVRNDQSIGVGNNQETTVGHNNYIQIGGNQIIDVQGNKDERVVDTIFVSSKDLREEIDDEVVVLANSQQYRSSSITRIDGGSKAEIKAAVVKVN